MSLAHDLTGERAALEAAAAELRRLEQRLAEVEAAEAEAIAAVTGERQECARNLLRYLSLRQEDLRELQRTLAESGLSSLGRSEMCVQRSVLAVSRRIHESLALRGDGEAQRELERLSQRLSACEAWDDARRLLQRHTHELLGERPIGRHIYILVTAPSAQEADAAWMTSMLHAGMNVLRINTAHEGPTQWQRIARQLELARRSTGRPCRVLMDLAGPKIRTGKIGGSRQVVTWKPLRDEIGEAIAPARVLIRTLDDAASENAAQLLMARDELSQLKRGDVLRFIDARGKRRELAIDAVEPGACVALGMKRSYVREEVRAEHVRKSQVLTKLTLQAGVGSGAAIALQAGDELVLTARAVEGRAAQRDHAGRVVEPALISCTLPEALTNLEVGHRVLFDEGRVAASVMQVDAAQGRFLLRVERTQRSTLKLRAEKGINLPDTEIGVAALSAADREALKFVARHADVVSLSFVRRPEDVRALRAELARLGRPDMGVVLKIETRRAFENLPRLLLEGLRHPHLGVMIARGDLAVEVGFERLAELQEEILWLCEASRVPVIWATQVLDTLARTGVPARAEVTDAAASVAAECVMLNKGPFVLEAVEVLGDILRRMEQHHYKKRSLFRRLSVSQIGQAEED